MPKIDFKDYQKQENSEGGEYTFKEIQTKDRQIFVKEEGIIFDIIDFDFDGEGPGMEILMSFIGEDFKMRCDVVPKDIFDTYDLQDYLIYLIEEYKPCLECKSKLLGELCSFHHGDDKDDGEGDLSIEFIPEDDDEKA